jgi:hypothetical protein
VTSVYKSIERRSGFPDASVDPTEARKQWGREDHNGPDEATKKRGGPMTDMLRLLREGLGDLRH